MFFTHTWITSGEQLSTLKDLLVVFFKTPDIYVCVCARVRVPSHMIYFVLFSNRSFGDKSGPPALSGLESEEEEDTNEECDVVKEEKQEEEEEEVQSSCGETRTDRACSDTDELSLNVPEEQECERSREEEEEELQELQEQKTTQGN